MLHIFRRSKVNELDILHEKGKNRIAISLRPSVSLSENRPQLSLHALLPRTIIGARKEADNIGPRQTLI